MKKLGYILTIFIIVLCLYACNKVDYDTELPEGVAYRMIERFYNADSNYNILKDENNYTETIMIDYDENNRIVSYLNTFDEKGTIFDTVIHYTCKNGMVVFAKYYHDTLGYKDGYFECKKTPYIGVRMHFNKDCLLTKVESLGEGANYEFEYEYSYDKNNLLKELSSYVFRKGDEYRRRVASKNNEMDSKKLPILRKHKSIEECLILNKAPYGDTTILGYRISKIKHIYKKD
ncbi:MAG: hypothetical protein IJ180_02580 [Bacteroidales bacterium]|nr:hypothetical protein [Bacteroidales bacterium]